jgi:DHA1 family tetracycline resistance protein-like MFS transporter
VQSVSQLIGPFLFTLTFAHFIDPQVALKLPGAPFYLASALLLLALGIVLGATKAERSN